MTETINKTFRGRVEQRDALLMPGAANALAALVIADLGFEAIYISGAGVTNTFLGMPDLAFIGLSDLVSHTAAIRNVTDLPLVVDADTGFGNAVNVGHTIRMLERAGASAVQIEDQVMPKRCGHFTRKEVEPTEEMVNKIKAAVDARHDPDLLVIARTDARAVHGFDAAVERANRFKDAGADVLFVEAPESLDEIRQMTKFIDCPQLINMVVGGRTPIIGLSELRAVGFALVLYANTALQGALLGMQTALGYLRDKGSIGLEGPLIGFEERQRLVRKGVFDELEHRYASKANEPRP